MKLRQVPLVLAWCAPLACGERAPAADSAAQGPASPPLTAGDSASAVATVPACPATGLWARCAIVERLDRAGLVPTVDSTPVTEPPLTATGFLVRLGRGELEVYLYPDAAARERDQARLDTTKYLRYASPVGMQEQPTLIASGNALAVLHSRNDHQRERVGDAITAGAPARNP